VIINNCVVLKIITEVSCFLAGILIGIIASILGLGGGALFRPLLTEVYGFNEYSASATSLFAVIFTSLSSAIAYARQRRIFYKVGILMALTAIPGAILGAYVILTIPEFILRISFGIVLILAALNMVKKAGKTITRNVPQKINEMNYKKTRLPIAMAASFFAGFIASILGIGGGIVYVPIMNIILDIMIHFSTSTSSFIITLSSTTGAFIHQSHNLVNFTFGAALGLGAVVGAQIGAKISKKQKPKTIQLIFAAFLIFVALRMIITSII